VEIVYCWLLVPNRSNQRSLSLRAARFAQDDTFCLGLIVKGIYGLLLQQQAWALRALAANDT